jgi:cell filamentation protein
MRNSANSIGNVCRPASVAARSAENMGKSADPLGYPAIADPYCYPGTTVLRNIPDLLDPGALAAFEAMSTAQRADEPLPRGRFGARHYRAIHRHLFQDVYPWAGRFRTVRLAKGSSIFCFPEHIAREMDALFGSLNERHFLRSLARDEFAERAAHFLSTLNAIHPFREGNGRAQMTFLVLLAVRAGHQFRLETMAPKRFLAAMIESFEGRERPLAAEIRRLIA